MAFVVNVVVFAVVVGVAVVVVVVVAVIGVVVVKSMLPLLTNWRCFTSGFNLEDADAAEFAAASMF